MESQDLNANVLNMLERQKGTKVYVGDTNQAIYMTLNHTVNVFNLVKHKEFKLTQSFRSSEYCLKEANNIIRFKFGRDDYFLKGMDEGKTTGKYATLSLTNSGVFLHAIKTMGRKIPFSINVEKLDNTIKIVSEIYDSIYRKRKHPFYSRFLSTHELRKYAYSIEDFELADACFLCMTYGVNSVGYLTELSKKNDPSANYCILTVHGSKGLEFDVVDYKTLYLSRKDIQSKLQRREEEVINLTYVAATRASKINI